MLKNILDKLTNPFNMIPETLDLSPQKNSQSAWIIGLLLIACLVIPPTAVAALSQNSVFFSIKAWGIEYQFQKGKVELPQHK
ncbi:hypothetical protein [Nostoc sp. FACHB-190]|uniref:hypothetical protein n=1 Tax=Nostoc sp. FACHB-190 TaxID=2692838 RepID=UPI001684EC41|nr:hypothetical protein [Nostoc sp. FACHB-190]MBD2303246.1 hypothetical protein [Nostoc sp. FACHB-190]